MSLNRSEQMTYDYLLAHPEEERFWRGKVLGLVRETVGGEHEVALRIEAELWAYFAERSAVATPFVDMARIEGLARISMRNLAEYLLRLWAPPHAKPRRSGFPGKMDF